MDEIVWVAAHEMHSRDIRRLRNRGYDHLPNARTVEGALYLPMPASFAEERDLPVVDLEVFP